MIVRAGAQLTRRRFLVAGLAGALAACTPPRRPEHGPVAAMFPGRIDDGGFMESGYRGLRRAAHDLGFPIRWVDRVAPNREALLEALRGLAASEATLVVAHGGQSSAAAQRVAWEFPEQRFVVIQGDDLRPNLAVYEVAQEESAWLAGALAGLTTRTNIVGHLSGLRVRPGLIARAAFAHGLITANPQARLLTHFTGDQDDVDAARRVALAEIDAGADVLFTMLNSARTGAIEACRARRIPQIGNALDWVAAMPDVFIASAVADAGYGIFQAARDLHDSVWRGDIRKRFGLRFPEAVRLALGTAIPAETRRRLDSWRGELAARKLIISDRFDGPEFVPGAR